MLPLLHAPAIAVDLPPESIRGVPPPTEGVPGIAELRLSDWAGAVVAAADRAGFARFVLVGHSLGGLTLTEVARRYPARVAHLVYVAALVPRDGERAIDAMDPDLMARVAKGLTDELMIDMMCNDLDEKQTRFVLDHRGHEVIQVMVETISHDGLPAGMAKTYVRLTRDQSLPPVSQDRSIDALRANVSVVELDTGHMVMIGRPDLLAPILDQIASSAS
jgi:pimeloyl-ACP methyl ester carboxylesterase